MSDFEDDDDEPTTIKFPDTLPAFDPAWNEIEQAEPLASLGPLLIQDIDIHAEDWKRRQVIVERSNFDPAVFAIIVLTGFLLPLVFILGDS